MEKQDKDVVAKLLLGLGVMVLLIVIVFLFARLASTVTRNTTADAGTDEFAQMQLARINERIAPIGRLVSGEIPTGPVIRSGKELTEATCTSCHGTGVLGAPKIGEAGDWNSRFSQGLDSLVTAAIDGKGAMPARGGDGSLTDEDIRKAVLYILKESGQDVPAEADASGTDSADDASTESADKTDSVAETAVAAVTTAATTPATGEGESTYASACALCHDSGVSGAPRLNTNADWTDRLAAGSEALYDTAINGKGTMPPKGGRTNLSDAAVKAAVDYMLQQQGQ